MTIPLWLDLGGLRVVHACWSSDHIDYLRPLVGEHDTLTEELVVTASTKGTRATTPSRRFSRDRRSHSAICTTPTRTATSATGPASRGGRTSATTLSDAALMPARHDDLRHRWHARRHFPTTRSQTDERLRVRLRRTGRLRPLLVDRRTRHHQRPSPVCRLQRRQGRRSGRLSLGRGGDPLGVEDRQPPVSSSSRSAGHRAIRRR